MRCGWRVSVMRRMAAGHEYSRRIVRGRTVTRPWAACRRIDRAGASISPPRVESGRPGFSKTCDGDARSAKLPAVARKNAPLPPRFRTRSGFCADSSHARPARLRGYGMSRVTCQVRGGRIEGVRVAASPHAGAPSRPAVALESVQVIRRNPSRISLADGILGGADSSERPRGRPSAANVPHIRSGAARDAR